MKILKNLSKWLILGAGMCATSFLINYFILQGREKLNYTNLPGERITNRDDFQGNLLSKLKLDKESVPHGDLARYYGGVSLRGDRKLYVSKYKPSKSKEKNKKYIAIKDKEFVNEILDYALKYYNGKPIRVKYNSSPDEKMIKWNKPKDSKYTYHPFTDLGNFIIDTGKDSGGTYVSYWDIWNYTRNDSHNTDKTQFFGSVKPFEIYDRIYYNSKTIKNLQ